MVIVADELKLVKMCFYAAIQKVFNFRAIIRQTYGRGPTQKTKSNAARF